MNLGNSLVVFGAIFLAELPDKTMLATLMLSTRFRRRLPTWIGVSSGYLVHVALAVTLGSALSKLPTTPVQLVVGVLFVTGGIVMLRGGEEEQDAVNAPTTMSAVRIAWTCASVILRLPMRLIRRAAAVVFLAIGVLTLASAF